MSNETVSINNMDFIENEENEAKTLTVYRSVSRTCSYPTDATTEDLMNLAEASGVFDFWDHPDEDVYSESDGNAV